LIGAFACVVLTLVACGGGSPGAGQSSASSTPTESATPTSTATTSTSSGSASGQSGQSGGRPPPAKSPQVSLLAEVLQAGEKTLDVCVLPSTSKRPVDNSCPRGSLSKKDGVRCTAVANFVRWDTNTASEARTQSTRRRGPWGLAEKPSADGGIQFTLDGASGPPLNFPPGSTWRFDVTCTNGASQATDSGEFPVG
jgi:hypothetical protein